MPTLRLSSSRKGQRGQSLVELTLALPFLVYVLLGTVDFARIYYLQTVLANAAMTGAQFALDSRRDSAEVQNAIVQEAAPTVVINASDITFVATPSWAPGNELRVTVAQDFAAITPFIAALWGGGVLHVQGSAVVRFNP